MKKIRQTAVLVIVLAIISTLTAPFASAELSINCGYAIVIDFESGDELYSNDADTLAVPASMTKVMTAYIIFQELESGNLTLETMIPISERVSEISYNPSFVGYVPLNSGASYSVDHMLRLILLPSGSAACIAMAEYISGTEEAFAERMNSTAKELGLTAEYYNSHGFYTNYITARSQALLVREFITKYPAVLEYTTSRSVQHDGNYYWLTNKLFDEYYYEGADGFKTGTTSEAGYCLSSTAERGGKRVIAVVMRGWSDDDRYMDTATLLDYGFEALVLREESEALDALKHAAAYYDVYMHWSEPDVTELKNLGADMSPKGEDGDMFYPENAISRGDFTQMLMTALEKAGKLTIEEGTAFNDMSARPSRDAVYTAHKMGIVNGFEDGDFRPYALITRQEAACIIARAWQLSGADPEKSPADLDSVSQWAAESVLKAVTSGIMTGYPDGSFAPRDNIKRGDAAALILRLTKVDFPGLQS